MSFAHGIVELVHRYPEFSIAAFLVVVAVVAVVVTTTRHGEED